MNDDYVAYLHECFQGEVLGEALGAALAASASDPDHRRKWRAFERLERETKERIRRALEARGETVREDPHQRTAAAKWAARYGAMPWDEAMAALRPVIEKYVRSFEKREAQAPADGRDVARAITRHERALLEFTVRELDGRSETSLEPIVRLLDEPPLAA